MSASRCLRVSKHWNEFLRTAPFIWRHLDFSNIPARRSVNLQTVRKYLKWADLDVRSICLKGVELQSSKFLKELAVKCKTLESLTVLSGGELRQSLMDCASRARALRFLILDIPLHGDTVRHIMNVATKLETASFAEITKMTPLSTYEYEKWDQNDFPKLLSFQVSSWNVKHEFAPLVRLRTLLQDMARCASDIVPSRRYVHLHRTSRLSASTTVWAPAR